MPAPKPAQPKNTRGTPAPQNAKGAARKPARRNPVLPRVSMESTTASVGAQMAELRAAIRRPRPTKRVGWGLFQDDIRRGRLLSLAGLAILVALGLSMATSPDYVVAGVTVQGSSALSTADANRLAGVTGLNIFLVDPRAVAARLSQSAFIKNVAVETALPNQVIIHVEERRPRVVWVLKDNTPYLVSEDGILMSQATTLDGYVVVYDQETNPGALKLGDALERDDAVDTAQRLFMQWPHSTGLNIATLEWQNSNGGITVVTDTDQRLMFGDSQRLDDKLRVCAALVADLKARNVAWSRLDLRSVDRAGVVK
jgi:cell division septal protein FtsQ